LKIFFEKKWRKTCTLFEIVVSLYYQTATMLLPGNAKKMTTTQILIGGQALRTHGSSRHTNDTDFLISVPGLPLFQEVNGVDYINAAATPRNAAEAEVIALYAEIYAAEQGNEVASLDALAEMKALSLVMHCRNAKWQKADDAEFDIKFAVRNGAKITRFFKYFGGGEAAEVQKIVNSVK
jgi:hypothetical protein